jgi:hypothetical protein
MHEKVRIQLFCSRQFTCISDSQVDTSPLSSGKEVKEKKDQMENLFTFRFCGHTLPLIIFFCSLFLLVNGDKKRAMARLRGPFQKRSYYMSVFISGWLLGMLTRVACLRGLMLVIQGLPYQRWLWGSITVCFPLNRWVACLRRGLSLPG